jgi:hypothetical protein
VPPTKRDNEPTGQDFDAGEKFGEIERLATAETILYGKLLKFIYGLDSTKFRVSSSQYISAEKVLVKLAASGEIENFARLRSYLAPLFSFSPEEKSSFNQQFDFWLNTLKQDAQDVLGVIGNENELRPATALVRGEATPEEIISEPVGNGREKAKRLWQKLRFPLLALLIFSIAAGIYIKFKTQTIDLPPATPTPQATPRSTPGPTFTGGQKPAPVEGLYFLMLIAAIQFPLLVWGLWLAWWEFFRKPQLEKLRECLNLNHPRADKSESELYEGGDVRHFAQNLRRHRRIPITSLDPDATVNASVARIGLFTPVYGRRLVSPEYLVLIDRTGYLDQQALLIDELIERLKSAGVFVDRYYFDGDPNLCRAAADNPRNPGGLVSFTTLASSHSDSRLLIFGEAKSFVETNRPSKLLALLLENWKVRILLSTAPAESYAERVLRGEGLPVLRSDEKNLQLLLDEIRNAENEEDESPISTTDNDILTAPPFYPYLLLHDEWKWLDDAPPAGKEIERLKHELRRYLRDDGYKLLTAGAVYPEVLWDLTFYLAHHLVEQENREATIALLVRLPWFRYGKMPDWLRQELLDGLSAQEQKVLRELIEQMMISYLENPEDGFKLELEKPIGQNTFKQSFAKWKARQRFYDLVKTEPVAGILREETFSHFLAQRKLSARLLQRGENYLSEKNEKSQKFWNYLLESLKSFKRFFYQNGYPLKRLTQIGVLTVPAAISTLLFIILLGFPDAVAPYSIDLANFPVPKILKNAFPESSEKIYDPTATPSPNPLPSTSPIQNTSPTPIISPTPEKTPLNATPSPSISPTPQPSPTDAPINAGICGGNDLPSSAGYAIKDVAAGNFSRGIYVPLSNAYPIGSMYIGQIYSQSVLSSLQNDAEALLRSIKIDPSKVKPCVDVRPPAECTDYGRKCVEVLLQEFTLGEETPAPTTEPAPTGSATPSLTVSPTPEITPTPTMTPIPTETLTPTPTPPLPVPLSITSMTIYYSTKNNWKEKDAVVFTSVRDNGKEIGRIDNGVGSGKYWGLGSINNVPIRLSGSIPYNQCSNLMVAVNKTGTDQWDVVFWIMGTLNNGTSLRLLDPTKVYKLGDNDNFSDAETKLTCPLLASSFQQMKK